LWPFGCLCAREPKARAVVSSCRRLVRTRPKAAPAEGSVTRERRRYEHLLRTSAVFEV
jgi:hypothetical protein